jgi:hypothetical protein
MPNQTFRVGGGYTAFTFNGTAVMYCDSVQDQGPRPVSQPETIQPLDAERPIEIAFPIAHSAGTLTLTIREQWSKFAWETLSGYDGTSNIIDVFKKNMSNGSISCTKIIKNPAGGTRTITYHNCVITDIDDSETVQVNTMTFPKRISLMYTHRTRTNTTA